MHAPDLYFETFCFSIFWFLKSNPEIGTLQRALKTFSIHPKVVAEFRRHIKIYQYLTRRLVFMDEIEIDGTVDFRFAKSDYELIQFLEYLSWTKVEVHPRGFMAVIEVVKGKGTTLS